MPRLRTLPARSLEALRGKSSEALRRLRSLRLTPAVPGMALYLDGPNITVPLRPGEVVDIHAAERPLRLVVG